MGAIVFESLLPVFVVIAVGLLLRKGNIVPEADWRGIELLGYWLLFPVLVLVSLIKMDLALIKSRRYRQRLYARCFLPSDAGLVAASTTQALPQGGRSQFQLDLSDVHPLERVCRAGHCQQARRRAGLGNYRTDHGHYCAGPEYYQYHRADDLHQRYASNGQTHRAQHTQGAADLGGSRRLLINLAGISVYEPLLVSMDIVGRAGLGIGLLTVGAGIRVQAMRSASATVVISIVAKLFVFPLLVFVGCRLFGVSGIALQIVMLAAAVSTAMNGYVLARQMGGDAEFYAAAASLQVLVSMFSIPLILWLVGT